MTPLAGMRFGSICSGIEAASQAWLPLSFACSFMSEIEPSARAVLQHHYPETPLHGDFTTIEARQYAGIDILVGGTPCQSFSVAGLRGGMADVRGNLALEYLRLADRLRPEWVVWENVPGVLSSGGGRDFGAFVGGLAELGYGWAYRVLDAQYFGLAQRRKRVFVVGYLGDWRRAAAVLFEPASLRWHPAPSRTARERIAPTIGARTTAGGGLGTDFDLDGGLISNAITADQRHIHPDKNMGTAVIDMGDGQSNVVRAIRPRNLGSGGAERDGADTLVAHPLRADGFDASEDGTGRGTPLVAATLTHRMSRNGSANADRQAIAFHQNQRAEVTTNETMGALNSGGGKPDQGYAAAQIGSAVRRLTPRECERLQGFPDDYTLIPWRGKPMADGPRYRLLGNSMAVPVMAWIGRRIAAS